VAQKWKKNLNHNTLLTVKKVNQSAGVLLKLCIGLVVNFA